MLRKNPYLWSIVCKLFNISEIDDFVKLLSFYPDTDYRNFLYEVKDIRKEKERSRIKNFKFDNFRPIPKGFAENAFFWNFRRRK